jgi:hypothetical protein
MNPSSETLSNDASAPAPRQKPSFDEYAFGAVTCDPKTPRSERFEPQDWVALELVVDDEAALLWAWHLPADFFTLSSSFDAALSPPLSGLQRAKALGLKVVEQLNLLMDLRPPRLQVGASLELGQGFIPPGDDAWVSIARVTLTSRRADIDLSGAAAWVEDGLRRSLPNLAPRTGPHVLGPGAEVDFAEPLAAHAHWTAQARCCMDSKSLNELVPAVPAGPKRPSL